MLKKQEINTGRNLFIDMVRGIAIILVCFAHCIQYGSGAEIIDSLDFFQNRIYIAIYSFHMPLLVVISGYLFWKSMQKLDSFWVCVKTRFIQLIIPVISWNTIRWILSMVTGKNAWSKEMLLKWFNMFFTEFWFLWAIFWCALIVYLVSTYCRDHIGIYVLLFGVFLFLPDVLNMEYYKFMYPFFVGAYLVHKKGILERLGKEWKKILVAISGVAWICLLYFYNQECYIYISGVSVLGKNILNQIGIDLYRTLIGVVGSIFIIGMIYVIYSVNMQSVNRMLAYIGKNTVAVYIVSSYINSLILMRFTAALENYNYIYNLFQTVMILLVCLTFSYICKKIPLFNTLLLGGR